MSACTDVHIALCTIYHTQLWYRGLHPGPDPGAVIRRRLAVCVGAAVADHDGPAGAGGTQAHAGPHLPVGSHEAVPLWYHLQVVQPRH